MDKILGIVPHVKYYPRIIDDNFPEETKKLLERINSETGSEYILSEIPKYTTLYLMLKSVIFSFFPKGGTPFTVKCSKGDGISIRGVPFESDCDPNSAECTISLKKKPKLEVVYLQTTKRIEYMETLQSTTTENFTVLDICDYRKASNYLETITKGSYGKIYRTTQGLPFSVKYVKPKKHRIPKEKYFLNMVKTLISNGICPNLPLFYSFGECDGCPSGMKKLKGGKKNCVGYTMELGSQDLSDYFDTSPPEEHIISALFQIMAAIHVIQTKYQIQHFDIKKENVVYYTVAPGGYWQYNILGKNFYVPNYGKLFVLIDFGVSRIYSPVQLEKLPNFFEDEKGRVSLGHRLAVLIDGKFHPFSMEYGNSSKEIKWNNGEITFGKESYMKKSKIRPRDLLMTKEVQKFLEEKKITPNTKEFYEHPEIIPPFEFWSDTQDGLRMFIGGKRTTQKGYHGKISLSYSLNTKLQKYSSRQKNANQLSFSLDPSNTFAGYFITDFFTKYTDYSRKTPNISEIIQLFIL